MKARICTLKDCVGPTSVGTAIVRQGDFKPQLFNIAVAVCGRREFVIVNRSDARRLRDWLTKALEEKQ